MRGRVLSSRIERLPRHGVLRGRAALSLGGSAGAPMAELQGRRGDFPACLRLRPVAGAVPPRFEVAEILNLNEIRNEARLRR